MRCLKCGHTWEREKWQEWISFLSKCPECESRILLRY